jgi:hypothetical protein
MVGHRAGYPIWFWNTNWVQALGIFLLERIAQVLVFTFVSFKDFLASSF